MRATDLRDLDMEELQLKLTELKEEIFNLRFRFATGQLDDYRRIGRVKREIARLQTLSREHEVEEFEEAEQRATQQAPEEESGD
jgi:large subunit ribosomal protein L29